MLLIFKFIYQHSSFLGRFKRFWLFLICFSSFKYLSAQGVFIPTHNKDYYHLLDKIDAAMSLKEPFIFTSSKPSDRKAIGQWIDSLKQDSSIKLSNIDLFNIQYLADDNSEWNKYTSSKRKGLLKTFFTNTADFYQVNSSGLNLHINPVLHLEYGKDSDLEKNLSINTRGIELRGNIWKKLGFYTYISENQAFLPLYVRQYANFVTVSGLPGEGYTKTFKNTGVDFMTGRGYITFNIIKNIGLQFGHDRHFIGNGYRSMILSDFSSNYTFLRINTKIWKFHYTNIFAQMVGDVYYRNELLPKKYFAFHHLSLNIGKHLNVGIFESVVFGRGDSLGNGNFDVNYLNPIIFYRSAEIQQGSQDNALLGMDFKLRFLKRFSAYGQLVLDEFVLKEMMKSEGYFGNKYAAQIGLKYFDALGLKNLDLQLEYNIARPYTYSHRDIYRNYAHYRMPLAHPLGANFHELIGIIRYQPLKRLKLTAKAFLMQFGSDTAYSSVRGTDNWGGNIMKDYKTASDIRPYGNELFQGIKNNVVLLQFHATWMLRHNLFLEFSQILRKQEVDIANRSSNASITTLGIRWNVPQRLHEF